VRLVLEEANDGRGWFPGAEGGKRRDTAPTAAGVLAPAGRKALTGSRPTTGT